MKQRLADKIKAAKVSAKLQAILLLCNLFMKTSLESALCLKTFSFTRVGLLASCKKQR